VLRETEMTHEIVGTENFLHRTLAEVGVPPLHILRARNAQEYRFYELTGDLPEALHFRQFEGPETGEQIPLRERIVLGEESGSTDQEANPASGRVVLLE
jgi:hypothetical protein